MDMANPPPASPSKLKPLSRTSSLRSALPRLAIPHTPLPYIPHTPSPLSAPPLSTISPSSPFFSKSSSPSYSSPLSAEPPPPPPPSAISPYRHTPILSRIAPLSPFLSLPSKIPTRFLQVRSLRMEGFTPEYLIARFPLAVRVWVSTKPGVIAARVEFESLRVATRVLDQHGGREAWRMGSYVLEMEGDKERNRWWERVDRRSCTEVKKLEELKEEEEQEKLE